MTVRYYTLPLLLLAMALVIAGCDQSSLNNEPNYADEYIITQENSAVGDAATGSFSDENTVVVPDTVTYFVQGFTIDKDYTWTVNGDEIPVEAKSDQSYVWEDRGGEFVSLYFNEGDGSVSVDPEGSESNTFAVNASQDEIEKEELEINAVTPSIVEQVSRLPSFSSLLDDADAAGVVPALESGGPFTVLGPRNSAFEELSAVPSNAVDDDEAPTSSVLGQILQYHAIAADVESGDISDGQTAQTLLGDQEVTFSTDDSVTVNDNASVTQADIPATDGVIHRLDQVLLPSTALVDFTDRTLSDNATAAGDTLTVDGSYFPSGGGFIVLHDSTALADQGAIPSIVGVSDYVEPGVNNSVKVVLDETISDTTTVGAMPHMDTNDNEQYDFETSAGTEDDPYTLGGDAANTLPNGVVIDFAEINVTDE